MKYPILLRPTTTRRAKERGTDLVTDPDVIEKGWRLFIPELPAPTGPCFSTACAYRKVEMRSGRSISKLASDVRVLAVRLTRLSAITDISSNSRQQTCSTDGAVRPGVAVIDAARRLMPRCGRSGGADRRLLEGRQCDRLTAV